MPDKTDLAINVDDLLPTLPGQTQRSTIASALLSRSLELPQIATRLLSGGPIPDDLSRAQHIAITKITQNPALLQDIDIPSSLRRKLTALFRPAKTDSQAAQSGHSPQKGTHEGHHTSRSRPLASTRHYVTPLRYPGGKGRLSPFLKSVIETNGYADGEYCEPYAGGASLAIELLLQEYVSRIHLNDISEHVHAFWHAVLHETSDLVRMVHDTPISVESWDRQKQVFRNPAQHSILEVGFSTLFLNRTNRSGILNGGIIGGRRQTGTWRIDARYNVSEICRRIELIGSYSNRISLTRLDALSLLKRHEKTSRGRILFYLDPPYYAKGKDLYYDFYTHEDHGAIATQIQRAMKRHDWIVSYDNAPEIRDLYSASRGISYRLDYSAREAKSGSEVMYFSDSLYVPQLSGGMRSDHESVAPVRPLGFQPRARERIVINTKRSRER